MPRPPLLGDGAGVETGVPTAGEAVLWHAPRPGALAGRALEYWLVVYRRTWRGSVVLSFLSPLLYLGAMGYGLGALVDASRGGVEGVPYVQFIAPGVLAAAAMQTAVGEATYPVFGAIKWQRTYFAMLASPLGVADLVLGHLGYLLLRVAGAAAVFLAVGAALGAFRSWWAVAAAVVAVLCGAAHAPIVMAFTARLQHEASGFSLLFRLGLMPMFLFAGTFFPVDQLPPAVRPLAWATPVWHATAAARDLALGRPQWLADAGHVAYLVLWAGVGVWLAVRSMRARLVT